MKKCLLIITLIVFVAFQIPAVILSKPETVEKDQQVVSDLLKASAQEDCEFVGSKNTKVFHTLECGLGKKIKPENKKEFETRDEAMEEGYRPCKVCKP